MTNRHKPSATITRSGRAIFRRPGPGETTLFAAAGVRAIAPMVTQPPVVSRIGDSDDITSLRAACGCPRRRTNGGAA